MCYSLIQQIGKAKITIKEIKQRIKSMYEDMYEKIEDYDKVQRIGQLLQNVSNV